MDGQHNFLYRIQENAAHELGAEFWPAMETFFLACLTVRTFTVYITRISIKHTFKIHCNDY